MAEAAVRQAAASDVRLTISGLNAFYGESHVLHGLDIEVRRGEVVALLGRNGAGKTTTLRSIMGLVGRRTGTIRFDGVETIGLAPTRSPASASVTCPRNAASSPASMSRKTCCCRR
ncbi:ATP-binding cassette domain-containing protein [Oleomonas cavernae]